MTATALIPKVSAPPAGARSGNAARSEGPDVSDQPRPSRRRNRSAREADLEKVRERGFEMEM